MIMIGVQKNNDVDTDTTEHNDYFFDNMQTRAIVAVTLSDLLSRELPPRANFLNPWLPKQGLCMVYAARGVGKTFFALEVAMAIAYGASFLSFVAPRPARVLYIDGEMPAITMQERLASIETRMVTNPDMIEPDIITPDFQDGFMPDLSTLAGQESICVYTDRADLIIVDNISTLNGAAKENDAEGWLSMQQWGLGLRRQGKSVLFIHHAGKSGQQRGSSKREDVLDTVIALKHPSDYEPSEGASFELHFEKNRGMVGDDVNPILCKLTESGWEYKPLEQSIQERVAELINDGYSQKEIVDEIGKSKGYVSKCVKKATELGLITIKKMK